MIIYSLQMTISLKIVFLTVNNDSGMNFKLKFIPYFNILYYCLLHTINP